MIYILQMFCSTPNRFQFDFRFSFEGNPRGEVSPDGIESNGLCALKKKKNNLNADSNRLTSNVPLFDEKHTFVFGGMCVFHCFRGFSSTSSSDYYVLPVSSEGGGISVPEYRRIAAHSRAARFELHRQTTFALCRLKNKKTKRTIRGSVLVPE